MGTHRQNATAPLRTAAVADVIFHGHQYLTLSPGWGSLRFLDCSRAQPRWANNRGNRVPMGPGDRSKSSSSYRNQWAVISLPECTYPAMGVLGHHSFSGASIAHLRGAILIWRSNPHMWKCEHCASPDLRWFTPTWYAHRAAVLLCMACRRLTIVSRRVGQMRGAETAPRAA
jgi:hypothetical protein